jgi:hypothetical protein
LLPLVLPGPLVDPGAASLLCATAGSDIAIPTANAVILNLIALAMVGLHASDANAQPNQLFLKGGHYRVRA